MLAGTSAALMMANLQAIAHGRLLLFDNCNVRPEPDAFVSALNRDISSRKISATTDTLLCFTASLIPELKFCAM